MKKGLLFFYLGFGFNLYAMEESVSHATIFKQIDPTQRMCIQVNELIRQFNELKSQSLTNVPTRHADLLSALEKMIFVRTSDLKKFELACENNTADLLVPSWKDKKTVAKITLAEASVINALLRQKQQ